MAKHRRKSKKYAVKEEQKQHVSLQQHRASSDNLHDKSEPDKSTIFETPFSPRMNEHAEMLNNTSSNEQRSNLVMQLQQTYGNRYVQRLLESTRDRTDGVDDENPQVRHQQEGEVLVSRTAVKEAPPVPTNKPWKKNPPPVPTSKPWREKSSDGTKPVKIQDLAQSGTDLGGKLKGADLVNVANFAEGIKNVAAEKGKPWYVKLVESVVRYLPKGAGLAAKGAKFVWGKVKGESKEDSGGGGVLDSVKKIMGPIPDAVKTVINVIKVISAAAKKKTKEAWEAVWETVKSGVNTVFSTLKMVFGLISKLGGLIPIVGDVANGVSAIFSFIEGAYATAKKILKLISINKLISKITGLIQGADEKVTEKEEGKGAGKKERLEYIKDINIKRRRNIKRQIAQQVTNIIASGAKLVSAVLSVVGGIISLAGVTAPVGGVIAAFAKGASIFGTVVSTIGKVITQLPKVGHKIRQAGRDIAAKKNIFGKAFRAMGFSAEKSSEKKKEKLKEVVTGLVDNASGLKTEFNPAGKDRATLIEEVKAEVPKFDELDFELEAMGVNKSELYNLNKEKSLGNRLKGQIKLIYSGLKSR